MKSTLMKPSTMFCGSKKTKRKQVVLDTLSLSSTETGSIVARPFQDPDRLNAERLRNGIVGHRNQQGCYRHSGDFSGHAVSFPQTEAELMSMKSGQASQISANTSGLGSSAVGSDLSALALGSQVPSEHSCNRCGNFQMGANISSPLRGAVHRNFVQGPSSDYSESSNSDRSRSANGISGHESCVSVPRSNMLPPSVNSSHPVVPLPPHLQSTPQPMHTQPLHEVAAHVRRFLGPAVFRHGPESIRSRLQSESSWRSGYTAPFSNPNATDPDEILVGLLQDLEHYQQFGCNCGECEGFEQDEMLPVKEYFFGPDVARDPLNVKRGPVDPLNRTCLSEEYDSEFSDDADVESFCPSSEDEEDNFTNHYVVDSGSAWQLYAQAPDGAAQRARVPSCLEGRKVIWTKGQLKVEVYVNHGLLTVHVVQARHLSCKSHAKSNPFVKVSLVPDHKARTRCRTETRQETSSPVFDEKFSYELLEEDYKKRILISVWHQDKKQEELLGCMSFGILPILLKKRTISGWYYLLAEELGRTKHLQVVSRPPQLAERVNQADTPEGLLLHSHHMISIERGEKSFGFTVTGLNPVVIGRVHPDSPAEAAGLQKGDYVVSVNRLNVLHSPADSVAKIIKHAEKRVTLEVRRPHHLQDGQPSSQPQGAVALPAAPTPRQATPAPVGPAQDKENQPVYAKVTKRVTETSLAKKVTFNEAKKAAAANK